MICTDLTTLFLYALWHSSEYRRDASLAGDDTIMLTMDYSQNISLPNVADTPAGWYFLSLISVSMFGIYSANMKKHITFLHSEFKRGKGANEVTSMLHRTIELHGSLDTTESDAPTQRRRSSCLGGQLRRSVQKHDPRLVLTPTGRVRRLEEATLKFLVKGHTKNPCDRVFAFTRSISLATSAGQCQR